MMRANQKLRVIELRNYLLKADTREKFIDYFEAHFIDSQNILGGYTLGQFRIKGEDDRFFWVRGFTEMNSRSTFLREFYGGPVWEKFGPEANTMMLEWHHVHLLKPLNGDHRAPEKEESLDNQQLAKGKGVVVVDFYTAKDNQLDELIDFFKTDYVPFLKALTIQDISLWVSETTENDFPRLPVIQDKNLLVAISGFADEADYQSKARQVDSASVELKSRMQELIAGRRSLILDPTNHSRGQAQDEEIRY